MARPAADSESAAASSSDVFSLDPHKALGAYGTVDVDGFKRKVTETKGWLWKTASWFETSDDTDPVKCLAWCCECEEEFRSRRLKAPVVLGWLLLQLFVLYYQAGMLSEISGHIAAFEGTLAENCGPQHMRGNVCLGPTWNLTHSSEVIFPAVENQDTPEFDFVIPADHTFTFQTSSHPATFLVGVEPLEPHRHAGWNLDLRRQHGGRNVWAGIPLHMHGHGETYSVKVAEGLCVDPCQWTGSMTLTVKYPEPMSVHLYVVDSMIKHLEDIHRQSQCSFETSWQYFSERHEGHHLWVLTNAWHFTAFFLLVQLFCIGLMLRRFLYFVEGGKLLSRMIVAKFIVQDIPQQMCIVIFIYGWYSRNGLRCQMCLFHPDRCDDEYPLHWSNAMLCLFTLLSACSNQLLLQIKAKKYEEDEDLFHFCVRFGILSVSTLPFSTAMLLLSATLLHLNSVLVYFIVGFPCIVGWAAVCCLPTAAICEDDDC